MQRRQLIDLFRAAVSGAMPEDATRNAVGQLPIDERAPVHVVALGKAAIAMIQGASAALADAGRRVESGVAVAPDDVQPPSELTAVHVVRGDHPIPASASLSASVAMGAWASEVGPHADVVALISGGGSSLLAAPAPNVESLTQAQVADLYRVLLASGADIHLINAVRKRFARWAGGRLAAALAPARVHCLVVSDVPGDDPGTVSAGPCAPDPLTADALVHRLTAAGVWQGLPEFARVHLTEVARGSRPETLKPGDEAFRRVETRVIVSNAQAVSAAAARARAFGIEEVIVVPKPLEGEAAISGVRIASDLIARRLRSRGADARRSRCVIWGGETTVTFVGGHAHPEALGGRNQELALAAARSLTEAGDAADGITVLAAGTDGRDGPTDAAGAIVDRHTWPAIQAAQRDPARDLARHDAYRALDAAGALIRTGATGTNVMDVVIGLFS